MAYKHQNVIVGAAAIYLSVKDSTDAAWNGGPAVPAGTSGNSVTVALEASSDWVSTGYTSDGLEIAYEPNYGEVEVDQSLDTVKMFKQSMTMSANTTFAEATLKNLLIVMGQKAATLTETSGSEELGLSAGALGDDPVERALVAVGRAPAAADGKKRERIYYARRVLSVETSNHSLRRNEATVFPVSFRLLPDAAYADKEYGTIKDRVITP
jgi:hypothetical protein